MALFFLIRECSVHERYQPIWYLEISGDPPTPGKMTVDSFGDRSPLFIHGIHTVWVVKIQHLICRHNQLFTYPSIMRSPGNCGCKKRKSLQRLKIRPKHLHHCLGGRLQPPLCPWLCTHNVVYFWLCFSRDQHPVSFCKGSTSVSLTANSPKPPFRGTGCVVSDSTYPLPVMWGTRSCNAWWHLYLSLAKILPGSSSKEKGLLLEALCQDRVQYAPDIANRNDKGGNLGPSAGSNEGPK